MNTPAPISDHDYEAIAEAVMETERGRWFLTEFARRNRAADTALVLRALEEVERRLAARAPADNQTFAELLRHVASRAALLREALESGPEETRGARALRHLDRLENLVALAAPKDDQPLSLAGLAPSPAPSPEPPVTIDAAALAPPVMELSAPATPRPAPVPNTEFDQVTAALAELLEETPVLAEAPTIVDDQPATIAEAPPPAVEAPAAVVPITVEPERAQPTELRSAVREPRAAPKLDPVDPPRPASQGLDLLASLSAAERAMLFA